MTFKRNSPPNYMVVVQTCLVPYTDDTFHSDFLFILSGPFFAIFMRLVFFLSRYEKNYLLCFYFSLFVSFALYLRSILSDFLSVRIRIFSSYYLTPARVIRVESDLQAYLMGGLWVHSGPLVAVDAMMFISLWSIYTQISTRVNKKKIRRLAVKNSISWVI